MLPVGRLEAGVAEDELCFSLLFLLTLSATLHHIHVTINITNTLNYQRRTLLKLNAVKLQIYNASTILRQYRLVFFL